MMSMAPCHVTDMCPDTQVQSTQATWQFKLAQHKLPLKTSSQGKPSLTPIIIRDRARVRDTTSECSKYSDFPPIPTFTCPPTHVSRGRQHRESQTRKCPEDPGPSVEAPAGAFWCTRQQEVSLSQLRVHGGPTKEALTQTYRGACRSQEGGADIDGLSGSSQVPRSRR